MKLTGRDLPDGFVESQVREQKRNSKLSLADKLIEDSAGIVERVINTEEDREGLRYILMLRHPQTGVEPSVGDIKQFLTDLPSYILSVHSQYLYAKKEKERLLAVLRPKAERLIIDEKMKMKSEGIPLSVTGSITKDDIRDKLHTLTEFAELSHWEQEEETLEKIVSLLESRRFELSKILDVESRISY